MQHNSRRSMEASRIFRGDACILLAALAAIGALPRSLAFAEPASERFCYLFTSFEGNGEAGLQFLHSDDGWHWQRVPGTFLQPNVGSGLMRDPSIARGPDGRFHLVWTTAWRGDRGFGYASSADLVHWTEQRFIPVMEREPTTVNVWAPEIFYDRPRQRFIICWASTIPGRFPENGEPVNNNQRLYYTITRDFETFAPTELLFDPGFNAIDGVIVELPDESHDRYALVLKDNSRNVFNLRVAFGDSPTGPWREPSAPFTGKFTEGPSVLRARDQWMIFYDCYRAGYYGAALTRDFCSFVDASTEVSIPSGHKHGTVINVNREELSAVLQFAEKHSPTP